MQDVKEVRKEDRLGRGRGTYSTACVGDLRSGSPVTDRYWKALKTMGTRRDNGTVNCPKRRLNLTERDWFKRAPDWVSWDLALENGIRSPPKLKQSAPHLAAGASCGVSNLKEMVCANRGNGESLKRNVVRRSLSISNIPSSIHASTKGNKNSMLSFLR